MGADARDAVESGEYRITVKGPRPKSMGITPPPPASIFSHFFAGRWSLGGVLRDVFRGVHESQGAGGGARSGERGCERGATRPQLFGGNEEGGLCEEGNNDEIVSTFCFL